jgi:four helix bundle protein
MQSFKELNVWQASTSLCILVYKTTKSFPKDELYGITSQIRRCSVSIPSNIAEGFNRQSTKEFIQFLQIAFGSSAELETQLIIAKELNYLDEPTFNHLVQELTSIRKMLSGLIKSLRKRRS